MKRTYIQIKMRNIINIDKLVTLHYFEFPKGYVFEGESHNFWELMYVDRGEIMAVADGVEHILSQGEIIFHKPNEFHSLRCIGDGTPNIVVMTFHCHSRAMDFFRKRKVRIPKNLTSYIKTIIEEGKATFDLAKQYTSFRKLVPREDAPIGGQQMIRATLELFLIELLRNFSTQKNKNLFVTKESAENYLVSQIMDYLKENIYTPSITMSKICDRFKYSKTYLSATFKQSVGDTILNYHTRLKIEEAAKLIRKGDLNFVQISDLLGFNNPHYFSRVFRRITNMSPTEYKQSVKSL